MTVRVSMLLKSCVSMTCFRTCFLPGRAKDLSEPRLRVLNPVDTWINNLYAALSYCLGIEDIFPSSSKFSHVIISRINFAKLHKFISRIILCTGLGCSSFQEISKRDLNRMICIPPEVNKFKKKNSSSHLQILDASHHL